ncbi:MAG: GTPase Era [Alphaproteobacteria bacterium]
MQTDQHKFCFIAVIGPTNAGKSTLVNALVGAKVSIVTPRQQTTRNRILGIFIKDHAQIALIDTPGIFAPKRRLDRAMVRAAWDGAQDADRVMLVIDANKGVTAQLDEILNKLKTMSHRKLYLALNKIDLIPHQKLLSLVDTLNKIVPFEESFLISALKGDGLENMAKNLASTAPLSPWMFDEDQLSDLPERLLVAEITRERLFLRLHDELPYAMTVETDLWESRKDGSVLINQTIYVTKETHRSIVLGKSGQQIKEIGQASRHEMGLILDRKVHLKLFVKLREKWQEDPNRYRVWNLDFNLD